MPSVQLFCHPFTESPPRQARLSAVATTVPICGNVIKDVTKEKNAINTETAIYRFGLGLFEQRRDATIQDTQAINQKPGFVSSNVRCEAKENI